MGVLQLIVMYWHVFQASKDCEGSQSSVTVSRIRSLGGKPCRITWEVIGWIEQDVGVKGKQKMDRRLLHFLTISTTTDMLSFYDLFLDLFWLLVDICVSMHPKSTGDFEKWKLIRSMLRQRRNPAVVPHIPSIRPHLFKKWNRFIDRYGLSSDLSSRYMLGNEKDQVSRSQAIQ